MDHVDRPPFAVTDQEQQVRSLTSRLRMRVLVPLALAILVGLGLGAAVLLLSQHHHEQHDALEHAQALRGTLEERTDFQVGEMRSLMALIMGDPRLQALHQAGDRQGLLKASEPVLEAMRAHNGMSHLYFIRPDGRVLLRVHDPARHGDRVDRLAVRKAQQTGAPAWGYEQGPAGSFTLRASAPWIVDGRLVGYLETGVEFEDLLAGVGRALDVDLLAAVDKARVDRQQWEQAQVQRGQTPAWDAFPSVVLLTRSIDRVPTELADWLSRPGPGESLFRVQDQGRVLQAMAMPLRDSAGEPVARLVALKDRTEQVHDGLGSVVLAVGLWMVVAAGVLLFLHVVLGRAQNELADRTNRLAEARRVLAEEQDERQRAQHALALQQERNKLLEGRHKMVEELSAAKRMAEEALRKNEEVTAKLVEAQSELMASAREAGRAEIATNVLHNVGNVLNSVNISAGVIGSGLRNSRLAGLTRAMQLMSAHAGNLGEFLTRDEKGRLLPGYLTAAVEALDGERQGMLEELDRLTKSIDHIKDVVASQQAHAAAGQVVEPVQPTELAEEALRMQGTALARHQVAVVREYEDIGPVPLDRGRVLQILVNLISNAKAAMSGLPAERLQITVGVHRVDGQLRFTVRDEGEGIPPENLTRIFSHGFTTRKKGHGFGLHSSALAARDLGGSLRAASDGPGRGATFTLDLPLVAAADEAYTAAVAAA